MKDWKSGVRHHYTWLKLRFMPTGHVLGFDKTQPEQGWIVVMTPEQLKKFIVEWGKK